MSELSAIAELQKKLEQKDYEISKLTSQFSELKHENRAMAGDVAATEALKNEIDWLRKMVEKLTAPQEAQRQYPDGMFVNGAEEHRMPRRQKNR